jgi:hypothetical protein
MIIEVTANHPQIEAMHPVGLLVHGNIPIEAQAACIAYVMPEVRRHRRRFALSLSLSKCHQCPCAVFCDRTQAEAWLNRRLMA